MAHPADDVLQRCATLQGTRAEYRQVVRHLLAGCPECAARIRAASRPPEEVEHDRALSRVFEKILSAPRYQKAWNRLSLRGRPTASGPAPR